MTRRPLLHPFLLTMHAVLAPLAANIESIGLQAIRVLGIALIGLSTLLMLLRWRLRDPRPWNAYLNLVGAVLLVFPIHGILTYTRNTPGLQAQAGRYRERMLARAGVQDLVAAPAVDEPQHDVYYIILDGYARQDVLKELYGFDNSALLAALAERGFTVPAARRANYADTVYSLASSLNMAHVDDSPEGLRPGIDSDQERVLSDALAVLIHQNRLAEFLRAQGYAFIAFDNGYPRTSISSADTFSRSPDMPPFNAVAAFELMLMDTTHRAASRPQQPRLG